MLMHSIQKRNFSLVDKLLQSGKVDLTLYDKDSRTALLYALDQRNIVAKLLEAGADPDAQDTDCKTALMRAIEKKDNDLLDLLLGARVDLGRQDEVSCCMFIFYNFICSLAAGACMHLLKSFSQ